MRETSGRLVGGFAGWGAAISRAELQPSVAHDALQDADLMAQRQILQG
jgi:hypothetical protein